MKPTARDMNNFPHILSERVTMPSPHRTCMRGEDVGRETIVSAHSPTLVDTTIFSKVQNNFRKKACVGSVGCLEHHIAL